MKYQILNGDNIDILKTMSDNSIDSIVTDPPYGIDFLGKSWDANTGALETYQECLRVLKPGGHLLAFSAARTYHHLAITLEQAGFEIRDQIMWIYSSGFPKSQDVGRSIARSEKKVKNTKTYPPDIDDNRIVANSTTGSPRCQMCDKSTGPIWKKCPDNRTDCIKPWEADLQDNEWNGWGTALKPAHEPICMARKPLKQSIAKNVQEWGTGALNIDACRIGDDPMVIRHLKKDDGKAFTHHGDGKKNWDTYEDIGTVAGRFPSNVIGEITEPYQKYFYCPKVSRQERHTGFDADLGNNHPTVKPIELMKYLIKLVTPSQGVVLDPFNGSGSTGMAAVELGHEYIGIEHDANYCEIAKKRIEAHLKQVAP